MKVRKTFRRVRRLAVLGAVTGSVIGVQRARTQRSMRDGLGSPGAWPPLERSDESPTASVGDLARAAATVADVPAPTSPSVSETAVADMADDADDAPSADDDAPPERDGAGRDERAWVAPDEAGQCPLSHPVKANDNSGIFHEPGGRFYARTRAERCYRDAAAATADGYRAAIDPNAPAEDTA